MPLDQQAVLKFTLVFFTNNFYWQQNFHLLLQFPGQLQHVIKKKPYKFKGMMFDLDGRIFLKAS